MEQPKITITYEQVIGEQTLEIAKLRAEIAYWRAQLQALTEKPALTLNEQVGP